MITDEYCMEWLRSKMAHDKDIVFEVYTGVHGVRTITIYEGLGFGGPEEKLGEGVTLADAFARATNGWVR